MGRTLGGIWFKGVMDLRIPYPYREVPIVYDHKSTTDFKWALKGDHACKDCGEPGEVTATRCECGGSYPPSLKTNVQSTLYAWDTILDSQEAGYKGDVVDLQWTYIRTRGAPKALPIIQRVSMADIRPRLDKTIITANEQKLLRESGVSALDVPPNANACEAYGGCPYVEQCNLSPSQRIRSIMTQGNNAHSAFMQKLAARREEAGAPAPHPAPVDPPATVPAKSGTVNPPEAPAEAPTGPTEDAPPPAKSKPKAAKAKSKPKATTAKPKPAPKPAPAPPAAKATVPAPKPAPQPSAAVLAPVAMDPMALIQGLLEAAKDGRAIVVMVIPNGEKR